MAQGDSSNRGRVGVRQTQPAHVYNVCKTVPIRKYVHWKQVPTFYIDIQHNISYCILNSEIDDFFAGVFDVLKDKSDDTETVIDTILTNAHLNKDRERITYFNRLRKTSQTIIFASNPYERLLTGYIDEVYLTANDCANMTFQDFLDRVISGVKLRLNYGVNLFPPIVPGCRVCGLTVLAAMTHETLSRDLDGVLRRLLVSDEKRRGVLDYIGSHTLYVLPMLEAKLRQRRLDKCKPGPDLGARLWQNFQLTGILHESSVMPQEFQKFDHSIHVRRLAIAMVEEILKRPLSKKLANTQKRKALAEAYTKIKSETIDYIKDIYRYDFELFGYDNQLPTP